MGILDGVFGRRVTVDDEPIRNQSEDFKDILAYQVQGVNLPDRGCETIPGSYGSFGTSRTNPIPVNGIRGEFAYLNRLRAKSGAGFFYHRLGSISTDNSPYTVDRYELVSVDASQWMGLYFVPYYPWRSTKCPDGLSLDSWSSLNDGLRVLIKIPCFGTNGLCANFPHDLPDIVEANLKDLGASMAKRIRTFLSNKQGKWIRPAQYPGL